MSDRQLYRRSGKTLRMPVDSAVVIEAGDMCWNNGDDVRNAGAFTYVSANLDATQANFAAKFAGVAKDKSDTGDTADIVLERSGVFEFDCAAATFEVGDLVAPDDNATPDALLDQQVIGIGENGVGAIGQVDKRYSANTTRVLVKLFEPTFGPTEHITLFQGLITSAVDLVTDRPVYFPFKAVRLHSVVTVLTAGAASIALHNAANVLDDALVIADAAPVGAVDLATFVDANEYDLFLAGGTLSLAADGVPTAGEALFVLEIRPFNMQVA